ncbi:hypothetical protein MVEN_01769200 [Mycena venus]|uniref:Uncharacterized protein n=1 Tax=Mycena venus TaxID=2733690 RepID=A0A8H6XN15_9AGAR|nr:hypothetical protein MVEN_01769200 [Mycena venus]
MSHLLALADKWSRPLVGSSFITTSKRSPPLPNAVTGILALWPYQYATISKRQKTARRAYRGAVNVSSSAYLTEWNTAPQAHQALMTGG